MSDHGPAGRTVEYSKLDNHSPHHAPHVEEGEGPWLMSFADMVTLLMCFFILFFSTDQGRIKLQNPEELLAKLEALQKALGIDAESESESERTLASEAHTATGAYGSIDAFKKDMTKMSKDLDLVFTVGTPQPGEIELTFLNTHFFRSGQASLTPEGEKMLKGVASKLRLMSAEALIEVEGHTDSEPIKSDVYPSNWELSGARASTVVRYLQDRGMPPERMRASGLAHYKPIAPETDGRGHRLPENMALNRRIVVRVMLPEALSSSLSQPMGPDRSLAPHAPEKKP
jgi:chemotaxis protein MotB